MHRVQKALVLVFALFAVAAPAVCIAQQPQQVGLLHVGDTHSVVALSASQGAQSQSQRPDWTRLLKVRPGEVVDVTTSNQKVTNGVFVFADTDSLVIIDLSNIVGKNVRRAISGEVRRDARRLSSTNSLEVKGRKAQVLRIGRREIQRVTRTTKRSSTATVVAATVAGTVGGLFLGAWAGLAAGGGIFGDNDAAAALAFFPIAIGVPAAAGVGAHVATGRVTTEVIYDAGNSSLPLNEEAWRAVRAALPASLQAR